MAKCSFRQIWMKHHSSISMPDEDPPSGNPRFIESVIIEVFKELTSHPFNHVPKEEAASCVTRVNNLLRKGYEKLSGNQQTSKTVRLFLMRDFVRIVQECAYLCLSVFTHLIVGRFLAGAKGKEFGDCRDHSGAASEREHNHPPAGFRAVRVPWRSTRMPTVLLEVTPGLWEHC